MVNAAALVGLIKFLGGKRQAIWEKAESTRLVTARGDQAPSDRQAVSKVESATGATDRKNDESATYTKPVHIAKN
jgi:hypothetical protein